MFPRFPIYNFSVARERLMGRLQRAPLRCVALAISHLAGLAQIDIRALGVSRENHHAYLLGDKATKGVMLYDEND